MPLSRHHLDPRDMKSAYVVSDRLKSRESQKYIDLGLEEKKELSAFIYTELHSPKLTENESHETSDEISGFCIDVFKSPATN